MSRYEFRFVVDGTINNHGDVEFTIDSEASDGDDVYDNEEQEWYRLGHVQPEVEDDFYTTHYELSRRIQEL